jgi:hypothetical protein
MDETFQASVPTWDETWTAAMESQRPSYGTAYVYIEPKLIKSIVDSSDCKPTGYELHGRRFRSWHGQLFFCSPQVEMGSEAIQPQICVVPGVRRLEPEAEHSDHVVSMFTKLEILLLRSTYTFLVRQLGTGATLSSYFRSR